ncbi:MAG: hypothetical protein ACJAXJ_004363 [Colwellia sp.]
MPLAGQVNCRLIQVCKDEASDKSIPTIWRDTFRSIADSIKVSDFQLINSLENVRLISTLVVTSIKDL